MKNIANALAIDDIRKRAQIKADPIYTTERNQPVYSTDVPTEAPVSDMLIQEMKRAVGALCKKYGLSQQSFSDIVDIATKDLEDPYRKRVKRFELPRGM